MHEFGHSFAKLFDLYAEGDQEKLEKLLKQLDQEINLRDLIKTYFGSDLPQFAELHFNPLKLLLRHPTVTKIFGKPLGAPHCAIDKEEARTLWAPFQGQGEGNLRIDFHEGLWHSGCLYSNSKFFRSSRRSRMRASSVAALDPQHPRRGFDPVERSSIDHELNKIRERMSP